MTTVGFEEDVFVLPTSFAQERLWFLDQIDPGSPAYNLPASVRLLGRLDGAALRRALGALVERHETLRTTFDVEDGKPVQVVRDAASPAFFEVDLRALAASRRDAEAERLLGDGSRLPFDLRRGPLLRALAVRLGEEEHALLLTMHHVVSDGWSMGVLIREMSAFYAAFHAGSPAGLPDLAIQYGDFAVWQREKLHGPLLDTQLAYWRQRLAGAPSGDLLAADRPRAEESFASFRAEVALLALGAGLSERLRALARGEQATPFMVLLAALCVLLYRHSGQDDVVIGTPTAGRSRLETRDLIGLFLNTLVLRTSVAGNPSFRDVVRRVRETTSEAYAHDAVPFEKLIAELRPKRGGGPSPFFQVFFNMLSFPQGRLELPGLSVEYLAAADVGAKFDLTIYAEDGAEGIRFRAVYNGGLFAPGRMAELLAQYREVLHQAAADPAAAIDSLSLVTEGSRPVLPDPFQALGAEWQGGVHERFSHHAERAPERIALVDRDGVWTYGELRGYSNRVAHRLLRDGLEREEVVAIHGHRGALLVAAVLGVLKAGGAFTILDPAYPAERHVDCLDLAPPRGWVHIAAAGPVPAPLAAFLATAPLCSRLELGAAPGSVMDPLRDLPADDPAVRVGPDAAALVAFTSGSTGRPKGIVGRHGPLSHFLPWQAEHFSLGAEDRCSMLSGLSHDPLQRDMFTPLWFGGRLAIPDPDALAAPGWLAAWMRREGITFAHLTPAMGRLLTETAEGARVPSLRVAFFVGEALTWNDTERLRRLAPGVTCVNLYGSTETQRAVAFHVVAETADGRPPERSLPLGRGIRDVQLLVLTRAGRLAGVGEAGEIYLRSPHLSRGYLGDPSLTRERFLPNPLTGDAADRVYRTGDVGRYLPNGEVEFLGRADDQVKIRGFRVEPAEVQKALARHPGVRQGVVLARSGGPAGNRLVAYLVPAVVPAPTATELRAFLKQWLPDYMVPVVFISLPELPMLPNGKLDRKALAALETAPPETIEEGLTAPRTPAEEILAALWCELLGIETVGREQDFFELGGHSLLATQLASRLESTFRVQVPVRLIFDATRLADQAGRVETLRHEGVAGAPPIRPVPRGGGLPLSFAQQRLWFQYQLEPESPFYNVPLAVRLAGVLDLAALAGALSEVVRRHEVLRTVFASGKDGDVQVILPPVALPLPLVDLSALPASNRGALCRELVDEEGRRLFDLRSGLPIRALLVRLAVDEHAAVVTTHHVASDRWSSIILFREVAQLYEGLTARSAAVLPAPPVQYADYAVWQREWLAGEALEEQLSYWERQLSGAPPVLELPADRPRPQRQTFRGGAETAQLPPALRREIETLARREGATLFMVLAAAFYLLLHHHTQRDDLVVGSDVANRNRVELEGLIGFFVNQLVLRCDLTGDPSGREVLARVRETALGAYAHQDLPFQKVVERLRPERTTERSPLFQVKLNLHNVPAGEVAVSGLVLGLLEVDRGTVQYDVVWNLMESGEGLGVRVEYNLDLFDPVTIRRLSRHYEHILRQLTADPEMRLSALEASLGRADEEERRQVAKELSSASLDRLRTTGRKAVAT